MQKRQGRPKEVKNKTSHKVTLRLVLYLIEMILFLEEVLNSLVRNHALIENVSASLGALHHFDDLCICATIH